MTHTSVDQIIYLSPHLDDAVLSCGGRIWQQAAAGAPVRVLTVFAGVPRPDQAQSAFAKELHQRWSAPWDAVATRLREDHEALMLLGSESIRWDYKDCIYRQELDGSYAYPDEDALWGPMAPSDAAMVRELRDRMAGLPASWGKVLCVPLGAGRHIDHRIVRGAAEGSGQHLLYYEDFPYARDAATVIQATTAGMWKSEIVPLTEQALEMKVAAIASYRSQISSFWDGLEDLSNSVRSYAERLGGGRPAERYWRISEP